ncbi:MAG: carboxypeptidase-like regulatory domain-containing protein, partial [Actinomycetes bacterium]
LYSTGGSEPLTPYPAGGISVTAPGVTTIRYRSTDLLGNTALGSVDVRIDPSAPLSQSDVPVGWILPTRPVTLSATDTLSGVARIDYALDGGPANEYLSPFTVPSDGSHDLQFRATDKAGNKESTRTATVNVDGSAPVTSDDAPSGWSTATVAVHLVGSDSLSGTAKTFYTLGETTPTIEATSATMVSAEGTSTLRFYSIDNVGNTEAVRSKQVRIDRVAPSTTASAPTGWSATAVTVRLYPSDSTSGVRGTRYSVNGSAAATYTAPITVSAEGSNTVAFQSVDVAGNWESTQTVAAKVDYTKPVTTSNAPTGIQWQNTTVTLSATDALSGVARSYYKLGGGSVTTYTAPVLVSAEGTTVVSFWSVDAVGNVETTKTANVRIDKTTPRIQGTLTNRGAPLSGVLVSSYNSATHALTQSASTDASGSYSMFVPVGAYHVRFTNTTPASLSQYFDHKATVSEATTVTASGGGVVVSSDLGPTIQGTVTNRGVPLSGVIVSSFDATTHAYIKGVMTSAAGTYSMPMPPGSYHLRFTGTNPASLSQYYDHRVNMSDSATVTALGGICQVSADLGPTIQGTLTNQGSPLSGVVVSFFDATTHAYLKGVLTNAEGFYLTTMPLGSYHMRFTGTTPPSLSQYYDHQVNASDSATVTTLGGICQVSSDLGPTMQGTITNEGTPLSGVVVSAFDATTHVYLKGVMTSATGYYSMSVPTGSYHLRFTGTTPASLSQYHGHTVTASGATTISAPGGICLVSSDLGPVVQGTITNQGAPLSGVVVSAFNATTHVYVKGVLTNAAGYYSMSLPTGTYHLRFTGTTPASLSQYYDHAISPDTAAIVTATGLAVTVSSDLAPIPR